MQQVFQEVHALLADPSFHQHQLSGKPKRLRGRGFQWQTQLSTQAQSLRRQLVCSATLQCSADPVSAQALQSVESLEIDCVVAFAYRSLVANQQNGCPALHNACTANIINVIYHWGMHTAPFTGSTRASPIQSTSINRNKDHLISRRQLVSV